MISSLRQKLVQMLKDDFQPTAAGMQRFYQQLRKLYNSSIHSIGFYPAVIALLMLPFFFVMVHLEMTDTVTSLKQEYSWLSLKNANVATSIVSTIATGVLSLTAFSFSMVMVVMSLAASQMSNRVLDNFIGNRLQQVSLGCFIGTILSAFLLLTMIDDVAIPVIPSISIFILVLVTVADIFLFISFLHYVTKSIRYEQLIKDLHHKTTATLQRRITIKEPQNAIQFNGTVITSIKTGYFQGFNRNTLLQFLESKQLCLKFLIPPCSYIIKGMPLLEISEEIEESCRKNIFSLLDFYTGQEIDKNAYYGFLHLSEVAVKALSPGINDPGTAVIAINSLTDLLAQRATGEDESIIKDRNGGVRIILPTRSFKEIVEQCIYPIIHYGHKDLFIRRAFERMLHQLRTVISHSEYLQALDEMENHLKQQISNS